MKIGVVGCGSIGGFLCRKLSEIHGVCLEAVNDIRPEAAQELAESLPACPQVLPTDKLADGVDLVVEAATAEVVGTVLKESLGRGKQAVILSVGGVLAVDFDYLDLARKKGGKVYFPSGAIGALDALKAAKEGQIDSVSITTRKPPAGLAGATYLQESGINLDNLSNSSGPLEVFKGNALEAVKAFPKNINVAATLSLAGIGAEKTIVRIIADPQAKLNSHEVTVEGDFGKITCRTENKPSPYNPKTSHLAALSALALIRELSSSRRIGT